MPNILMIHLNKIHFNVETLMNEKISDKYEFPTYLNMENYAIKNVTEKHEIIDPKIDEYSENKSTNFEYRLVGVIIHQGIADGGHYYSLICTDDKMHDRKDTQWTTTENMKWMEFNDSDTKDFNFRMNFESECFGKKEENFGPQIPEEFGAWGSTGGGSSKSAYVLIYEKREFNDIKLKIELETVKNVGKNPEQIKKAIKKEKDRYLRSIYSSHNYPTPKSVQMEEEEKEDEISVKNKLMKSLECGDIAISRDYFPFLVIPHNISVFMSQEERDSLKYVPVQYNKESEECVMKVKFKDVLKFVPYKIFKVNTASQPKPFFSLLLITEI